MVKHTQTIYRQIGEELFDVSDHVVGLAFKGLTLWCLTGQNSQTHFKNLVNIFKHLNYSWFFLGVMHERFQFRNSDLAEKFEIDNAEWRIYDINDH